MVPGESVTKEHREKQSKQGGAKVQAIDAHGTHGHEELRALLLPVHDDHEGDEVGQGSFGQTGMVPGLSVT